MTATVLHLHCCFACALGASLALAAHVPQAAEPRRWQRLAALSATLLAALVLVPAGAYLAVRFPDWYGMYTLPLAAWPPWQQLAAGALPAAIAPLAAVLTAGLLRLRLVNLAWALMALGAAGTAAVLVWGSERLLWLGSREAYLGETRSLMLRLQDHHLLAGLVIMLVGLAASWLWVLYTLRRQRRALRGSAGNDTVISG